MVDELREVVRNSSHNALKKLSIRHQLYTFICLEVQKIISNGPCKYAFSATTSSSFSGLPVRVPLESSHLFAVLLPDIPQL